MRFFISEWQYLCHQKKKINGLSKTVPVQIQANCLEKLEYISISLLITWKKGEVWFFYIHDCASISGQAIET